jgi:hypothetical protein
VTYPSAFFFGRYRQRLGLESIVETLDVPRCPRGKNAKQALDTSKADRIRLLTKESNGDSRPSIDRGDDKFATNGTFADHDTRGWYGTRPRHTGKR